MEDCVGGQKSSFNIQFITITSKHFATNSGSFQFLLSLHLHSTLQSSGWLEVSGTVPPVMRRGLVVFCHGPAALSSTSQAHGLTRVVSQH